MIATRVVPRPGVDPTLVWRRGNAVLRGAGVEPGRHPSLLAARVQPPSRDPFSDRLRHGLAMLLAAVDSRQDGLASAAGRCLIGAGPGLTPLGDDYVGGSAVAVSAFGGATGFHGAARRRWLDALLPPDLLRRTTPVAAGLLEMARDRRAAPPLDGVLDLGPEGDANLHSSLADLLAVGSSTGRGWATAIGATAFLLAANAAQDGPENANEQRRRSPT